MVDVSVIRVWRSRDRHCLVLSDQCSKQTGELQAQRETQPQKISRWEKSSKTPSINLWLPHAHILTHKQRCTYKHMNMYTRIHCTCTQSPKTVIYRAVFFNYFFNLCVIWSNYEKKRFPWISPYPWQHCGCPLLTLLWLCSSSLCPLALVAEVQLDFLKQKGAIKRTLFLHNHQPHLVFPFVIRQQRSLHCQDFSVYLRVSFLEIISGASHIGI